jgi:hypothetical protein
MVEMGASMQRISGSTSDASIFCFVRISEALTEAAALAAFDSLGSIVSFLRGRRESGRWWRGDDFG